MHVHNVENGYLASVLQPYDQLWSGFTSQSKLLILSLASHQLHDIFDAVQEADSHLNKTRHYFVTSTIATELACNVSD